MRIVTHEDVASGERRINERPLGKKAGDTYFAAVEAEVANRRRKADILQFPVGVERDADELKLEKAEDAITCEGFLPGPYVPFPSSSHFSPSFPQH